MATAMVKNAVAVLACLALAGEAHAQSPWTIRHT
jgi:hypothetical protein